MESVYSKRIKAGKRRTYFFDVKSTRGNDYYLTITESRKRFNEETYERHKIFLYKEDFNKFVKGLSETVDYVKTELMPDFDFDAFNHEYPEGDGEQEPRVLVEPSNENSTLVVQETLLEEVSAAEIIEELPLSGSENGKHEEVDKW